MSQIKPCPTFENFPGCVQGAWDRKFESYCVIGISFYICIIETYISEMYISETCDIRKQFRYEVL